MSSASASISARSASSSSSSSASVSASSSASFGRIFIYGRRGSAIDDLPSSVHRVNATSKSKDARTRRLSPFFLGPVEVTPFADDKAYTAQNVENAWQYSKCFPEHENDREQYAKWMQKGFDSATAHRFPMGRGAKPAFSYHRGQRIGYIEARMKIYAPAYAKAVEKYAADVLAELKARVHKGQDIAIFDFDGYRHDLMGMSLRDVLYNPQVPMGHAFVLKMMLLEQRLWETEQFDASKVKAWDNRKSSKSRSSSTEKSDKRKLSDVDGAEESSQSGLAAGDAPLTDAHNNDESDVQHERDGDDKLRGGEAKRRARSRSASRKPKSDAAMEQ